MLALQIPHLCLVVVHTCETNVMQVETCVFSGCRRYADCVSLVKNRFCGVKDVQTILYGNV